MRADVSAAPARTAQRRLLTRPPPRARLTVDDVLAVALQFDGLTMRTSRGSSFSVDVIEPHTIQFTPRRDGARRHVDRQGIAAVLATYNGTKSIQPSSYWHLISEGVSQGVVKCLLTLIRRADA